MNIKTIMRYHVCENDYDKKDKTISVGEDVKKTESLLTITGNISWCSHCENSMEIPQKN